MEKATGPQTLDLIRLIRELRSLANKEKVALWKKTAEYLQMPTRRRRVVNLYKIEKYTKDDETALIPGKVLSLGDFNKKITVAAYQFSNEAKEKINKTGKAISIQELIKKNPKGKKVRILGWWLLMEKI